MIGVKEPLKNAWYVGLMFFAISMATPLVPENLPMIDGEGSFVDNAHDINGIPWWAFKAILLCTVPYFLLFGAIDMVPSEFPIDEDAIASGGIDPDIVQLTPKEIGRRYSYDERNEFVHRRRSTISAEMKELRLGIKPEEVALSTKQRRLSAMVVGDLSFENLDEKEDSSDVQKSPPRNRT